MGKRKQVQISVMDPLFDVKLEAVAMRLGERAFVRGKPSRSHVLSIALDEAYAKTAHGKKAEAQVTQVLNQEIRRLHRELQNARQNAVFALAIRMEEAWLETGRLNREWVRHQFREEYVKAIAVSNQSKIAVLLSVGEGCSNRGTMRAWFQEHYDGGGYRGIADLLSERYVPVSHNTIKRFADGLGVVPRKPGPRGKTGP